MGMSVGGSDELFKLAENAAPAEDRIMPTERTYLKSSKTVDLTSAIALLKFRKKDPEQRISGGLDDNSEKVRKSNKNSSLNTQTEDLFDTTDPAAQGENDKKSTLKRAVSDKKSTGRYTTGELMSELFKIQHQVDQLLRDKSAPKERKKEYKEPDYLSALLKGKHRVTFQINGMEFSVACLSMINDPATHCLVLCFDDQSDSFFTPPMQSELTIKYDGSEVEGKLFYFGMSFRLKEVGLRFLGFLTDAVNA